MEKEESSVHSEEVYHSEEEAVQKDDSLSPQPPRDWEKERAERAKAEAERLAREEAEAPPPVDDPKFRMALSLKDEGNELYKNGDYKRAVLTYLKAQSFLVGTRMPSQKSRMYKDAVAAMHLNLAAAYLKYPKKEDRALSHCDDVLKVQPTNVKAMYRKGLAYKAMGDVDHAREWLKKCPPSAEISNALREIAEAEKKAEEKQRNTFRGMFDRHAGELYGDAKPAPPPPKDDSDDDDDEKRTSRFMRGSEREREGMQTIDVKKLREQAAKPPEPHPTFDGDRELLEQERRAFRGIFDRHPGALYGDARPAPPPRVVDDDDADADADGSSDDDDDAKFMKKATQDFTKQVD